jgi:hypothetical protein
MRQWFSQSQVCEKKTWIWTLWLVRMKIFQTCPAVGCDHQCGGNSGTGNGDDNGTKHLRTTKVWLTGECLHFYLFNSISLYIYVLICINIFYYFFFTVWLFLRWIMLIKLGLVLRGLEISWTNLRSPLPASALSERRPIDSSSEPGNTPKVDQLSAHEFAMLLTTKSCLWLLMGPVKRGAVPIERRWVGGRADGRECEPGPDPSILLNSSSSQANHSPST